MKSNRWPGPPHCTVAQQHAVHARVVKVAKGLGVDQLGPQVLLGGEREVFQIGQGAEELGFTPGLVQMLQATPSIT